MHRRVLHWCVGAMLAIAVSQPGETPWSLQEIQSTYVDVGGPGVHYRRFPLTTDQTAQVLAWVRSARRVPAPKRSCQYESEGSTEPILVLQLIGGERGRIGHVWTCKIMATSREQVPSTADVRVQDPDGRVGVLAAPNLARFLVQVQPGPWAGSTRGFHDRRWA